MQLVRNKNKPKQPKTKNVKKPQNPQQQPKQKSTPFRNVGGMLGGIAGSIFGNGEMGANIGRYLGTGIGSIFGSGDYTMVGHEAKYNVLAGQVPKFSSTAATNIVAHREYLGDITGTAAFTNRNYPINPGSSTTFPWLSTIARNYEQYRFHGVVFEFRSMITDFVTSGAPGTVIMSTNYDSSAPLYTTKQQMENSEFAVSVKPTVNLMHMCECAVPQTVLPEKYVRETDGTSPGDTRLYDLGNFQFATASNPVQNLGELWVTYLVEFYKPILPIQNTADHYTSLTNTGLKMLGDNSPLYTQSGIGTSVTFSGNTSILTFPTSSSGRYTYSITVIGGAAVWTSVSATYSNCTERKLWLGDTVGLVASPASGSTGVVVVEGAIDITSPGTLATITFAAVVAPTSATVDLIVLKTPPLFT